MHPNGPLRINPYRTVALGPDVETVTVTLKQLQAINRLGLNGWLVDLSKFTLASDGMLEGLIENKDGYRMTMGIHPEGSTHT